LADFSLPSEWKQLIETTLVFCDREVVPLEKENHDLLENERLRFDEHGKLNPEVLELKRHIRRKSAEAGLYTLFGDRRLGGEDLGFQPMALVFEALFEYAGPGRTLIEDVVYPSVLTNGLSPVLNEMSDELRSAHLDDIASGEVTLCFALTEADAGSDVWNMRTRAERVDGGWRLNGSKQWITNAPYADYCMVFAVTDPELHRQHKPGGVTAFWVPAAQPGVSRDTVLPIVGHLGGDLGLLTFEDVTVPDAWVLGKEGHGLRLALQAINKGRVAIGAKCLGLAEWALRHATEYAGQRTTFGRRIGDHGQVQAMLADCAIDIYALKAMLAHLSWKLDADQSDPAIKETSIIKVFGSEMGCRVFDRCMQILGASGLSNELRLEEGLRWSRSMRIPDGTSEIQRKTIATQLLRGDTKF
jgi:acyl-CoA dehydrogenase